MPRRALNPIAGRRLILAALVCAAVALVLLAPVFALAMAPAIALFALFSQQILPGETRLTRLLSRTRQRRRPCRIAAPVHAVILVRRVGRAFAVALAMRPPPAAARALG